MGHEACSAGENRGGAQRAFVWPPRATADDGADGTQGLEVAPAAVEAANPRRAGVRDGLWRLERAWLSPTRAPLARRLGECDWAPDTFDAFCNRCGETSGPYETSEFGCSACAGRRVAWDRFVRLGAHAGPLRDWIHEVKFLRNARLGYELGVLLGERLRAAGVAAGERVFVAPVPAHWTRRIARGVDHAGVIALGVSEALRAPLVHALSRRWGKSQRAVPASARARNVSRAFVARGRRGAMRGATLVLVDDVRTTGATLESCVRAVRRVPENERFSGVWTAVVGVASHEPVGWPEGVGSGVFHAGTGSA